MSGGLQRLQWWLEGFAYDVIRLLLTPLPIDLVSAMAGKMFQWIGPLTSKHHIARTGMQIAFPDLDEETRKKWLKESWNRIGRTFGEFPFLHRIRIYGKNSRVEVSGLERLLKLKQQGRGAVLISGHFANWELMAAVFSQAGIPVSVTYRAANNSYFDRRIRATREAYGIKMMVPKSGPKGAKELIVALRDGESVALLNDQKFNEGISVPFFDQPAMTAPGPTRLALQTGVPLIPMSIVRTGGVHFKVTVHAPIKLQNSGDRPADIRNGVEKVTRFMEERIRENPTDWFWVHRRWPKEVYTD